MDILDLDTGQCILGVIDVEGERAGGGQRQMGEDNNLRGRFNILTT